MIDLLVLFIFTVRNKVSIVQRYNTRTMNGWFREHVVEVMQDQFCDSTESTFHTSPNKTIVTCSSHNSPAEFCQFLRWGFPLGQNLGRKELKSECERRMKRTKLLSLQYKHCPDLDTCKQLELSCLHTIT